MSQFAPLPLGSVHLLPGLLQTRFDLNRRYLMSLRNENLLQDFYLEAGLWSPPGKPEDCHWGWESPTSQVRGHFLGHWLSAAGRIYAATGDGEIKAKADRIVSELGRCQQENGGEWAGSIPAKYLDWIARGKGVWAPQYTLHKTLMGLLDMHVYAGSEQALAILTRWAGWFHRWTGQFSRQQLDDILDVETGGMLEVWTNLYGITGKEEHLDLVRRYDRPRLFEPLLAGEDPLTNKHANTTIPEIQGAARAWEVTGERRYRDIVEAYWRQAVTDRGYYCTGGQTNGEVWTPKQELAARLAEKTQEHCVVYNMMRLAAYLLRWTGDVTYADYWERNLYNGVLAQQHPRTGMIAYFMPLAPGAHKVWGTPTEHFWCCHGTLVQAHTQHWDNIYFATDDGLALCQYIPSTLECQVAGSAVRLTQKLDPQTAAVHRPESLAIDLDVACVQPAEFTLQLRLPWWLAGEVRITVNGEPLVTSVARSSYLAVRRTWANDRVRIELPRALTACPLPDRPDTYAFLDGPAVLAGLCDEERRLHGDPAHPETLLAPDNEREWETWLPGYRAVGQDLGLRFRPLYEIADERYTVYFPVSTI